MIRYAVKHDEGVVIALIQYRNALPSGFDDISKDVYDQGIAEFDKHKALFYESGDQVFSNAAVESTRLDALELKSEQRAKLLEMSNEIDLMVRLGEVTTDKQTEFDDLKALYQA